MPDPGDPTAFGYYGLPQEQQSARAAQMAAALRGQQTLGTLGMLSGDKALGEVGKLQAGQAEAGQRALEGTSTNVLGETLRAAAQKRQADQDAHNAQVQEQQFNRRLALDASALKQQGVMNAFKEREVTVQERREQDAADKAAKAARMPPATESDQLSAIRTGAEELQGLNTKVGGKGVLSSALGQMPFGENAAWEANRQANVDSAAMALAGGKRAPAILVQKVDASYPKLGDSEALKEEKKKNLLKMFRTAHNNKLDGWKSSGYDVSGFNPMEGEQEPKGPAVITKAATNPGAPVQMKYKDGRLYNLAPDKAALAASSPDWSKP